MLFLSVLALPCFFLPVSITGIPGYLTKAHLRSSQNTLSKMSDSSVPREYGSKKRDTNFPPVSEKNLQDALIDEKPESPTPRNHQSIALDAQVDLSPSSRCKLQQALTDENAWADPNDCVVENAWMNSHVKGLHEAFARARKAELSTCGYPELLGRCSAKEGIKQDLRYTLVALLVQRPSTALADDPSRHRCMRSTARLC